MDGSKPYHHGDLRAALLDAAEAELAESGVEGFSLRKVARRAGVSHAAPAHHFGDANGLLTALAAQGFERLVAMSEAADDPRAGARTRALIYGGAYVAFAVEHTALFRLCFSSGRPDYRDPALRIAADAAFERLAGFVAELDGRPTEWNAEGLRHSYAVWAVTHGLADLLSSGKMHHLSDLPPEARDRMVADLIATSLDAGSGHGPADD
ncbi:TetR/AcrR family transcriptional regulator [Jannaschia aquimarina]|uniref:BetI_3 protein n=1 Tax=Jannaschia aquimarina TaxID=935700 RepID=A0A0D1ED28_9RHOB|nr:TetR/AcrR family transcriptional regulator [Jannaschia aquimarina]KIT15629.1 HTH-type transcriptional regulator BetI [Jannaschia aquimarina]SNT02958.1 transcriptional regulator, TetR family [Jannaschia aquimarina]